MIYRTLTDTELRRFAEDPNNTAARAEAARRFLEGSAELADLQEQLDEAEADVARLQDEVDELQAELDAA